MSLNGTNNQQLTLLLNLLRAIYQNQNAYILLEQYVDQINDDFIWLLRQWATDQFAKQQELAQAINIARVIAKLSKLIQDFDKGNPVTNLEIAIAGYEVVIQSFNHEAFPQDWSSFQKLTFPVIFLSQRSRSGVLS